MRLFNPLSLFAPKARPPVMVLPDPVPVNVSAPAPNAAEIERLKVAIRQELLVEMAQRMFEIEPLSRRLSGSQPSGDSVDPMMGPVPIAGKMPGAYAFDKPWAFTVSQTPKRRPGSFVSTDTLRRLADSYDILRACISHLQREIATAPFKIVPKVPGDKSATTAKQVKDATDFFTRRGALGGKSEFPWQFEFAWIDDLSVIGAAAFHLWPNRGGGMFQVTNVDASTIKPILDPYGWPPFSDTEDAYEQWIHGLKVAEFTRKEMFYTGLYKRTTSPYFASPVEYILHVVQAALYADAWNRNWLTDGNIPDMLIGVPPEWTQEQMERYAAWFDAMLAGDTKQRTRAKFVPGGLKVMDSKSRTDQQFAEFELWLLQRTCAIMGVNPASIGFAGEQYKINQEAAGDATSAFGAGMLFLFRKSIYDELLLSAGFDSVQYKNVTARYERPSDRAQRNETLIFSGQKTPNEAREDEGLEPLPDGDTLLVQSSMIPLDVAIKQPKVPASVGQSTSKQDNQSKRGEDDLGAVLRTWRKKANTQVKRGRSPACPFASDALPGDLHDTIYRELEGCHHREDVNALFALYLEECAS